MEEARRLGLAVAAHVAELPSHGDTARTISFAPERYGHAVQMTPQLLEAMAASGGVVEICPTSNLKTLQLGDDYSRHPTLGHWLAAGYPIAICTDDTSLFGITLSDELARVAVSFDLTYAQLAQLAIGATGAIFEKTPEVVAGLVERCDAEANAVLTRVGGEAEGGGRVRAGVALRTGAGPRPPPRL